MLAAGTLLQQRYRIIRMLAQGGMGAVYEAEAIHLGNTPVAVKQTLFAEQERKLREQFEREAVTLARLRHPALPRVNDHFTEGAGQFLVMEFVPGDDMLTVLGRHGRPFNWPQVLAWADKLLDALDYIHSQSPPVIHRDIKPQNLKLTPQGEIFLIDFGLAKSSTSPSQTSASLHAYTLAYAPPEQVKAIGTDARSDLYSLAATLYHLMVGEPPVDARVREEVMRFGTPDPLRMLHKIRPEIPVGIAAVMARALAWNRDQRYPNAAAMREALRHAGQLGAATVPDVQQSKKPPEIPPETERPSPPDERKLPSETVLAAKPARRNRATILGVPLALVILVVGGYLARNAFRSPSGPVTINGPVIIPGNSGGLIITSPSKGTSQGNDLAATTPTAPGTGGPLPGKIESFEFETVKVDAQGNELSNEKKQARQFIETLGGELALELVEIPGGSFLIGSPNDEPGRFPLEGPQRQVSVSSFWMGKYEVTQPQWRLIAKLPVVKTDLNPDPSLPVFKDDEMPVGGVSWDDANEFCARLSRQTGREYRLPTEAEWEYAARAGTATATAFGPSINAKIANCSRQSPMFVGRLKIANGFGLFDLHGNVAEWCQDEWHENYNALSSDGKWSKAGDPRFRPVRGSNWGLADLRFCRSAMRLYSAPDARNYLYGLRVVTSVVMR